ncbi:MAG: 3-isopropylmalate dehydratase large subunit [Myxococcota bacterium]
MSRTLLDKIWDPHVVSQEPGHPALLYIDLHLIHEVTTPQAFDGLRSKGLAVRRPDRVLATMDHSTPTDTRSVQSLSSRFRGEKSALPIIEPDALKQLETLRTNCSDFGIDLYELGHPYQGIVHVIGPEQGRTLPGMTIVCGDSHTSTHGAFGALAMGIGTSEVEMVLASQVLLQKKPRAVEVRFEGQLSEGVSAKDMILALIAQIGTDGGTGAAFEYTGEAVRGLSMEGRMTLCNMSIEAGARAGMVAPDDVTFDYLSRAPFAPKGSAWKAAVEHWRELYTDDSSAYDRTIVVDASRISPMVTYGTTPAMAVPVDASIPPPDGENAARMRSALEYMDLEPGVPIAGQPLQTVFVGSCTNSRLSDLRTAARIVEGRRVAPGVRMVVVPGSARVKALAEAEGLHESFLNAGAEWREPGCSMCLAMNGDRVEPGAYALSTSNRNFEGRQGKGARTFLASPATAAASAVAGCIADPRRMAEVGA